MAAQGQRSSKRAVKGARMGGLLRAAIMINGAPGLVMTLTTRMGTTRRGGVCE